MKSLFSHSSKAVFIVVIVMMVAACSFKTMYKQLDYMIPSYVEGMVSLDSMLEEKVEQRTLVLINWHRNTQLEQYAKWLRVFQRDASAQLTEEKMLQHIATLDSFWKSLSLKLNEEMVRLLPLLNAEQREELFSNIADKNDEFREEYVDIDNDERTEQYFDRMMDSYETWLGDLTDEQESVIKQAAAKMQAAAGLRLEHRQQWQQSIRRIIHTTDSTTQKAASLTQYFKDFTRKKNVVLNTIDKSNRQLLARLTVRVVHNMTAEQKVHFVSSTDDYIRMFTELAEKH